MLARQKIRVISSDTIRAGAIAQLEAFTHLLGIKLYRAENPKQLGQLAEEVFLGVGDRDRPGEHDFEQLRRRFDEHNLVWAYVISRTRGTELDARSFAG